MFFYTPSETSSRLPLRIVWQFILIINIVAKCPLVGGLLFTDTDFTISNGNRICFDATIIDNDVIDYTKYHRFNVGLQNGTYHEYFNDYTQIVIIDNEGWFSSSYDLF